MIIRIIPFTRKFATKSINLIFSIALMISVCFGVIGYWALAGDNTVSQFKAYWVCKLNIRILIYKFVSNVLLINK